MIDLKQIHTMWAEDCQINQMKLADASRDSCTTCEYLELHSTFKLMLKRAEFAQKTLLKDKWLYYNGKMSEEELTEKDGNQIRSMG